MQKCKMRFCHRRIMRECASCKESIPIEEFTWRGGGRKGLQSTCKFCTLERLREHRAYTRRLVGRWKLRKGCSRCGFKAEHSCQLDLDHIDPTTKNSKCNGRAFEPSWSVKRIKEELSKCVVLCKNCHALKTYENKDYL